MRAIKHDQLCSGEQGAAAINRASRSPTNSSAFPATLAKVSLSFTISAVAGTLSASRASSSRYCACAVEGMGQRKVKTRLGVPGSE